MRAALDDDHLTQVGEPLGNDVNWVGLMNLAQQHAVTPLLRRALTAADDRPVPEDVLTQLDLRFHANRMRNEALVQHLAFVVQALARAGVVALAYKGPTLAVSAYGDLALREFADLDLLVSRRDFARAKQALGSEGYRPHQDFGWESTLVHEETRIALDLHRAFTSDEYQVRVSFEGLWARRTVECISGASVPSLSADDMLLALCLQLAKDCWEGRNRLIKVCDIAALTRRHRNLDWRAIVAQAHRVGAEYILHFGLRLANDVIGAPVPAGLRAHAYANRSIRALVVQERGRLVTGESFVMPACEGHEFYARVRERLRDQITPYLHRLRCHIRRVIRRVVMPNEKDRAVFPLPSPLSFLYFAIRPCRLLVIYAAAVVRTPARWLRSCWAS